ncbi:hypothetical protein PY365_27395 [Roseiarcaceae bacterium H3SJ34-1]|uniref:hypothetical protein n=1 Tax=Terripilifer ovatus TaxID=3032367 RepID=UPI003AB991A9|nr:hypothetical protein [Roseiarcaceae bacterium H3SJ34-1]
MAKLLITAVVAPLMWAGAASAMPAAPLTSQSSLLQVRTVCNESGQCCATGSGQCFDFSRQWRRRDYYQPRRYYEPQSYGYYRQREVDGPYYGGRREYYYDD